MHGVLSKIRLVLIKRPVFQFETLLCFMQHRRRRSAITVLQKTRIYQIITPVLGLLYRTVYSHPGSKHRTYKKVFAIGAVVLHSANNIYCL